MTMDLMQLEAFLDARCGHATEQANRHLSEKARHEDEAERNKEVAVYCDRAAVRVRGLREYLMQAPSGLAIEISATVKAEPTPAPAPVDDGADAVSSKRGVVSGGRDADRLADEGDAPLRHDEAAVLPDTRAEHRDAVDAEEAERPVPEPAGAASSVQDHTADTDEGHAAKTSRFLSLDLIHELADLWEQGKTVVEMAEAKGVTKGTVSGLAHRRRDLFPKREPAQFKPKPKPKPAQSPMVERLVPRPVPAPYNPIAIGNVREIAPLMNEMRVFFAKCEAKAPGAGLHEVASLEVRFNTTDLRIERALTALAEAGEIEWSASLKGHVTVRALKLAGVAA